MFRVLTVLALAVSALLLGRLELPLFGSHSAVGSALATSVADGVPGNPAGDELPDPSQQDSEGAAEDDPDDREALLAPDLEVGDAAAVRCSSDASDDLRPLNLLHRQYRPPRRG